MSSSRTGSNRTEHVWSFLWWRVGGDSNGRMQPMPGREAIGCLPGCGVRKRDIGRYLGFADETLAREWSPAVLG